MFVAKFLIVPSFILLVSLAGRYWGTKVAGILAGMPVVAGPIVIFMALEQGTTFGIHAACAAMTAVASLLFFGVTYCWLSRHFNWYIAFLGGTLVWIIVSVLLTFLPNNIYIATFVTLIALSITPRILPPAVMISRPAASFHDLPVRMLAGGMFTLIVTSLSHLLTDQWGGMLAVFPIIGSVMAIFTHISQGHEAVAVLYYGTVRGLYSLVAFFLVLAVGWALLGFWTTIIIAIFSAGMIQFCFNYTRSKLILLKPR